MNTKKMILITLAVCFGVLYTAAMTVGGLQGTDTAAAAQKGITVRVLLFSGRPDPVYVLEDQQMIDKIKNALVEAKRAEDFDKETVIPSILGYKGILVDNLEMRPGLPSRLAVYEGTIEVMDEQKRFLVDEKHAIEEMLMDEAIRKGVIDEVILKRMRKDK